MKFRVSIFTLLFAIVATNSFAQNRVKLLNPGDSIGNKIKLPKNGERSGYSSEFVYNISTPPPAVANGLPLNCNLVDVAQESVNRFQTTHLYNGYVDLGRDFLDMGYQWAHDMDYDGASWRLGSKKDSIMKSKLMKTIFSNKIVQEAVYQWLAPAYLDAYSVMSVPEQEAYITMFEVGIAFADTFNLETQTRVVAESENYSTAVGSLNAFIYRRIFNKQLTRQDCIQWMQRIISDLKKNKNKNPKPVDDLVLMSSLGYNYYASTVYTDANGYGAEFTLLRKRDEEYEILPVPIFRYGNYESPQSSFFTCYSTGEKYQRYFFYCDSLGYTFTTTNYEEDVKAHVFLGSGKSARVLMIYYYDFDWEDPNRENGNLTMASVVDLDSGYVLHDSVGVPEYTVYTDDDDPFYDPYGSRNEYPTLNKDRTVFYCYTTDGYGVMDRSGNILLPPNYKSVELTDDPEVVKVNGKKLVSVRGGGKPPKKKK